MSEQQANKPLQQSEDCGVCKGTGKEEDYVNGPNLPSFVPCSSCGGTGSRPRRAAPVAPKHPMQHIVWDGKGVIRFQQNDIVRYLLDHGGLDLNQLHGMNRPDMPKFSKEDWAQFAQLTGYSVSAFGDLQYASRSFVDEADKLAMDLWNSTEGKDPGMCNCSPDEEGCYPNGDVVDNCTRCGLPIEVQP